MYSSSDFGHLFIRYKAEDLPEGESIQAFCLKDKVPCDLFHKWYKDTRPHIVPVQVDGCPEEEREVLPASITCAIFTTCVASMSGGNDMNSMEKSMLLDEVFALLKTEKSKKEQFMVKLERMTEQLLALTESSQAQAKANEKLTKVIDELKKMLLERDALIEKLRKENASLKEQKKLSDKNRASGSRESVKEGFDGTSVSDLPSDGSETDVPSSVAGK